jgi:cob(I)alamin adenosyltransferase
MAFKIYTKTGDKGNTSLIGGTKVPKSDLRIDTYGTVDELNSWIGLINDQLNDEAFRTELKEVQDRLFTIGSSLATDGNKEPILPGGHVSVSSIHVARCVCRRAERLAVGMQQNELPVDERVIRYLNRLSDYLFTLARYVAQKLGAEEIPWKPRV